MKNWLEATVETRNAKEPRKGDDKCVSFLVFPEFGSLEAGITIDDVPPDYLTGYARDEKKEKHKELLGISDNLNKSKSGLTEPSG